MEAKVRTLVRKRARNRCEYCRLVQAELPVSVFHVEHIVPRKHGGDDDASNLALSCDRCNLYKGANLAGIDPDTGKVVQLFNPRRQLWSQHFRRRKGLIIGRTACGRATVAVCAMNTTDRVRVREELRVHRDK